MAESVSILEGNIARKFYPVKKLRTSNGSTYDTWVPESEVEVTSLSVTERGVYYPANDGVYGYDEVDIDLEVADYTDGMEEYEDPDTGDTKEKKEKVTSEKDPDTGEDILVVTELPTSMQIITLPRTLNYVDGQNISIEGIVVHAYYEDGRDWGEVPFEELSFEPKTATRGSGVYTTPADDSSLVYRATGKTFSFTKLPLGGVIYGNMEAHGNRRTYTLTSADTTVYVTTFTGEQDYDYVWVSSAGKFNLHYRGPANPTSIVPTERDYICEPHQGVAFFDVQAIKGWNTQYPTNDISGASYQAEVDMVNFGGGSDNKNTITVSWTPTATEAPETEGLPATGGNTLTDTYDITVGIGPIPPNNQ